MAAATRFGLVAVLMAEAEAVLLPMLVAPAAVGLRCTSGLDLRIADSTHWFPDRKTLYPRTTGNSRRSMGNAATNRRFGNVNSGGNGTRMMCSGNRAERSLYLWCRTQRIVPGRNWQLVPEQNGRLAFVLWLVSPTRRHP